MEGIFLELTLVLILAGGIALLVSFFKQPSIIAYIAAGLLIGPLGYVQLQQHDALSGLAQIGITLLLFMVGLELDTSQFKRMGKSALLIGVAQVVLTTVAACVILLALGVGLKGSLFLGVALAFSSTIIVVKLLTEKRDLESLYGKLAVAILLIQDFVAIIFLILLSSFGRGGEAAGFPLWQAIALIAAKAILLLFVILIHSKYILPWILKRVGKSDELLLIFSLAWALGLAAFVSLPIVGFSLEVGGFLAGVALAHSGVHYQIGARIKSLRDFFIIIFFIVLGSQFALGSIKQLIIPAVIVSLFVIFVKPLIVFGLLVRFGYKPRTAFFTGTTLSQVSEFSLIVGALGFSYGVLGDKEIGLLTLVAIITISISSYSILYNFNIYEKIKRLLSGFERADSKREMRHGVIAEKNHVVLIGAHRLGSHVIDALKHQSKPFIIVDFNPEVAEKFAADKLTAICGDITDSHIQELVNIWDARLVISTVPDLHDNLIVLDAIKRTTTRTTFIVTAHDESDAIELYNRGADYVILPHFIGGVHLSRIFKNGYKFEEIKRLREQHLRMLGQI